ncbi:Fe-S oxidoreductase [Candidatus Magnetomorum sp. HK-1]|nr:Fe-S oxidoreductase [Candidatus Magnetomorum sp. HK-1]
MTQGLTTSPKNYSGTCIRCGSCMSVCPIYQVSLQETDVARGKMELLEWERSHPEFKESDIFNKIISRCLLCGACENSCPNKVPTKDCIQEVRQHLSQNTKEKIMLSSLKSLMKSKTSGTIFRKSGSFFQHLVGKKLPDSSGMHLRFPLRSMSNRKFIPEISSRSFANMYSSEYSEPKEQTKRIVYFTGCGANYLFIETARALMNVFEKYNIVPFVPQEQVCCGLPFYASGDQTNAIALAKKNIDVIDHLQPDVVLTTCASCGSHIHQWIDLLKNEPDYHIRAQKIAKQQKDAMIFLMEENSSEIFFSQISDNSKKIKANIWYHHPCHLRFGKTQSPLPKKWFDAFPHVNIIYSDDKCCGNGGKFQLSHFDLSMKIFDKRMDDFSPKDIHHVLTSCTGCQLQFSEGMLRHGMTAKVAHPLTWLANINLLS